ncbi:hypothetical protein MUN84_22485 (plasmid) [Hymenobacter sp. 5516J-16]|uniref:hypothetical protein n=1 Tax=Hymenobacter sp. 5516J-16 TaxID=2932253 RepID=UPI001FD25859|nr:hypothetical protein [Hymenobacter sp. 5516J-16]UOQ79236.1 hypothetical protein MUN84_22485 [Hymenobacter sp. 5516J-16]
MANHAKYLLTGGLLVATTALGSEVYCDGAAQSIHQYYVATSHQPKANAGIFRGRLLDVYTDSSLVVYRGRKIEHPVFYRFEVVESWAPSYEPQPYVTALTYADQRLPLQPGHEYLVATLGTTRGAFLWLDRCDLLKPLYAAGSDLRLLGRGTPVPAAASALRTCSKRVPASLAVQAPVPTPGQWIGGMALLTALNTLILLRVWRRR